MKTPYQVHQELARIERLVPHLISDQGERAEEILGFHLASLYASAPIGEHATISERARRMQSECRAAAEPDAYPTVFELTAQPQLA